MSDVIGKAAIPFTARGMAAGFNANILFSDENLEDSTNTITFAAIKRKKLMEKQRVIDRITKVAHRHLPPNSRLLLYGSRARGEARKDSDWDLLILLDQPEITESDFDNVSFPFTLLGWEIGELISPQMYTKQEWDSLSFTPYYKNVEQDKIVLV